jgi:antitoxin (DNA-binding transcriptional repressor) of toxin-antitoxin stability system
MSITITIEEAQANLKDLVHGLAPGDEIIITENQQTVAKIISEAVKSGKRPPPGLGKGSILFMAPGFDEPFEKTRGQSLGFLVDPGGIQAISRW